MKTKPTHFFRSLLVAIVTVMMMLAVALIWSSQAKAGPTPSAEYLRLVAKKCGLVAEEAEIMMDALQDGVSARQLTKLVLEMDLSDGQLQDSLRTLEMAAGHPLYPTAETKQQASRQLSNLIHSDCMYRETRL